MAVSTLLLLATLAAGPVVVALMLLAIRSLVSDEGHRRRAGLGLAATLVALSAYGAVGFGGMEAYSDSACSKHTPAGFQGALTKGTGLWPPGLQCRFKGSAGQSSTYRSGYDAVWHGVAATAVIAATVALAVVALDQARRRLGWAPTSRGVGPSAR